MHFILCKIIILFYFIVIITLYDTVIILHKIKCIHSYNNINPFVEKTFM